jgi:hypothetical protein
VHVSALLGLYPPAWRERYADEVGAVLETRPLRWSDRLDLLAGALDAWLHPARRSLVPPIAALLGGGIWTVIATAVLLQPAPPDWPGYLAEMLPLALLASVALSIATIGCALRGGDAGGRAAGIATLVAVLGFGAWSIVLLAEIAGGVALPVLAATQTVAMVGVILVGSRLVLAGDEPIGLLLVAAGVAMLIPWSASWLVFGTAWTAIGIVLWVERWSVVRPGGLAT